MFFFKARFIFTSQSELHRERQGCVCTGTPATGRERERYHLCADSFLKWLQLSQLSCHEALSKELHMGPPRQLQVQNDLSHSLLLSQAVSTGLDQKWSSWGMDWHPYGMLMPQGGVRLVFSSNMLACLCCFFNFDATCAGSL